jgi:hypothetical protein
VTYLNDAVFMAPSMLLNDRVEFREVNARAFEVVLRDRGHCVTARVYTDERGVPRNFSTWDRFVTDPRHPERSMVRTRWCTPFAPFRRVDGRMLPTAASAVWSLPDGPFSYVRVNFEPGWFHFNRTPAQLAW